MSNQIDDVAKLHAILANGEGQDREHLALRRALCEEEARELALAMGYEAPEWKLMHEEDGSFKRPDFVEIADAAADLAYVSLGTLIELYGEAAAHRVWNEVQRSNMDKFPDGKTIKREDGKGLKPPGWTPPNIAAAIDGTLGVSPFAQEDGCDDVIFKITLHEEAMTAVRLSRVVQLIWDGAFEQGWARHVTVTKALMQIQQMQGEGSPRTFTNPNSWQMQKKLDLLLYIIHSTPPTEWRTTLKTQGEWR